MNLTKTVI